MLKKRTMKQLSKRVLPLVLILAFMFSLAVPFNLTVFAADEAAGDSSIYAFLYRLPGKTSNNKSLELVFQNTPEADASRYYVGGPYSKFAGTAYHTKNYKYDDYSNIVIDVQTPATSAGVYVPWYEPSGTGWNINTVTFRDKIKPTYIASWFYNCQNLTNFVNFENLDTSNCKDMAYAFYNIANNEGNLTSLDLSGEHFKTDKVQQIDYFIKSGNLRTINLANMDLKGVGGHYDIKAGKQITQNQENIFFSDINSFVSSCSKLTAVNVDGLDISRVIRLSNFITYNSALEELDLSKMVSPKCAYHSESLFRNNTMLKHVVLGSADNLFEIGTQFLTTYGEETLSNNSSYATYGTKNLVYLGYMFSDCSSLEEVDFQYYRVNQDMSLQYNHLFNNCSSLEEIKNLGNLFNDVMKFYDWGLKYGFYNCSSLTEIDMSGNRRCLGSGEFIFAGCTSLRALDLRNLGTKFINSGDIRVSSSNMRLSGQKNVYRGCDELSEVYFSPYYPPKSDVSNQGSQDNYPPSKTWVKIENPTPEQYSNENISSAIRLPENYAFSKTIYDEGATASETRKSSEELFADFKPEYAGRWIVEDKIALRGNGGAPDYQSFDGAKYMAVDFDESEITEPGRTGYNFAGWYSEKEGGEPLVNDGVTPAVSWIYYAHWNENHYTLKLCGNGGSAVVGGETVTEITADDNLLYSKYYELSNSVFEREGYVLSGWNTRPNGTGEAYAGHESVNKLTATNNGEAKLYAQWHKPDVIITFDAQGGEAVANKNYTLKTGEPTYYGDLPETTRADYTFMGWFTEPDGAGKKVVNKADKDLGTNEINQVTSSLTLYAYWKKNPTIIFDANGNGNAYFNDDPAKTSIPVHYKYGQNLGVIPTPYFGACELEGWYTAPTGGEKVTSATPADNGLNDTPITYYAHWGYKPQFDTNGGVYKASTVEKIFPAYKVQTSATMAHPEKYVIYKTSPDSAHPRPTLPEFVSDEGFQGWWFNGVNLTEALKTADSVELDLSAGEHVVAQWATRDIYKVTLDLDGGALADGRKNPIEVYAGNTIEELPTPTKKVGNTEYEFLGWYTAAEGGSKADSSFEPAGNCTLYARWAAKNVTLTFNPNEGELFLTDDNSTLRTMKVAEGHTVSALPGANRDGYVLEGWFSNPDGTGTQLTATTPVDAGTTVYYAKWSSVQERKIVSADGVYNYSVRWATPSNEYATNMGDHLVVVPPNGSSGVSVMLAVEFNYLKHSGDPGAKVLSAGTVQIKVPKYAFKDINGAYIGSDNISNGLSTTETSQTNFVYDGDSDPDYYIITNIRDIDGSQHQSQTFRISYSLTPEQLRTVNGGHFDENGNFAGDYYRREIGVDPLNVNIKVTQEDVSPTDYTKDLGLEIHTKANTEAYKMQDAASFGWNTAWGTAPADADQYFYITWTLTSSHNDASSQKFAVEWSEDPVHQGSVVYMKSTSDKDTYYSSGTFRTTVVTKHPRKFNDAGWKDVYNEAVLTVKYLSGYEEKFRVSKLGGAYLLPDGDEVFEKYIKGYKVSTTKRNLKGAQELIMSRTSCDYMPFTIKYLEYKNVDSDKQWFERTKKYSTKQREIILSDGAKGDQDVVLSSVKGSYPYSWTSDHTVDGPLVGEPLGEADYCFSYVDLYLTEFDAVLTKYTDAENRVISEWSEPYIHDSFADYGDIEVWKRAAGSADFTLYKTVTANDLSGTAGDAAEFGVATARVNLPDDTVGYRIVHKSSFYTTNLFVNPNLCLKSTGKVYDFVKADVANGRNTLVKNKCSLTVNGRQATPITEDTRDTSVNGAYLCSYELSVGESTVYAAQNCAPTSVDDGNGNKFINTSDDMMTQEITAVIAGWGTTNAKDANNGNILRKIESGVFYDLLPAGFTVDKSTVFIKARTNHSDQISVGPKSYYQELGSRNFPASYYSVDLIENWENSGRTMMKVTVNTPEDIKTLLNYSRDVVVTGYNVFYKMKTSLTNILANGEKQSNSVSFTDTTADQSPPKFKSSAITSGLDSKSRPYYKELDNVYTAYANGTTACMAPSSYTSGVSSAVRSDGSVMFDEKTVGLDIGYAYDILYRNSDLPVHDIVIYDVIENSLDGTTYDWHGSFLGVDISGIGQLRDAADSDGDKFYCAPKVYYCVTDDPITSADLDITNTAIWTDVEPSEADKARVKAIAVDCRKNTKGGNFTLPSNNQNKKSASIAFSINLISPKSSTANDVMTYNEAYVNGSVANEPMSTVSTLAKVRLHYAIPEFHKTSFPESGEDAEHRVGVLNPSTIDYYLTVSNNDKYVSIKNIVVEDVLDNDLILTNPVKAGVGNEVPIDIESVNRVTDSYITSEGGCAKFGATITYLAPGETLTFVVPGTVNVDPNIDLEQNVIPIENTARITSANNKAEDIPSETTYHFGAVCKAKVKKVDVNGNPLEGATLQILNKDKSQVLHQFESTSEIYTTNLEPGDYVLRELYLPGQDEEHPDAYSPYKKSDDIPFTIDNEGIHYVNGQRVSYVSMVDRNAYNIYFHENQPDSEEDRIFRTYGPGDVRKTENKINHFYDIPSWAGDEYVFAGWYHNAQYTNKIEENGIDIITDPVNFENDTYTGANPAEGSEGDYHIFAKWIKVGTLEKASGDGNSYATTLRGFGLAGVQIREENTYDPNTHYDGSLGSQYSGSAQVVPGGLRYVTSLSENLLNAVTAIPKITGAKSEIYNFGVEYGYVVGTEANIDIFVKGHGVKDPSKYRLQYKGDNVNGVDTTGSDANNRTAENDYRYISNVNCTSMQGATQGKGVVEWDHKNFTENGDNNYRLYTLVVTYAGSDEGRKGDKLDARSYMRYYDANGWLRVFYNDYSEDMYYGGCMCSYSQVEKLAAS